MHKNAIKNERGVNFSEILPQKLVIFPLFWAFLLVIFVTFWLKTRNFQEKFSGNTEAYRRLTKKISKEKWPQKFPTSI